MDELEFRHLYLQAIEPGLCHRITCHLRLIFQKHDRYMPYQIKEIREAADLTFDPLFLPQPKSPSAHTPASPVPMSHVPASPYPPQAQLPNPHTLKVPHPISGSHAPALPTLVMPPASPILHVSSGLRTGHLHTLATLGTPYEAKKARSIPEHDQLLDVFICQLEDKMTSTGHGDLWLHPGPHGLYSSKCPSSLAPHSSSSSYVPLRPASSQLPS